MEQVVAHIIRTINHRNLPLRVRSTVDAYFFDLLKRFLPLRLYLWPLHLSLLGVGEGRQL